MFDKHYLPYVEAASRLQSRCALGSETIAQIAAYAVALAVSRHLPMPSAKVENPMIHFNETHLLNARDRIAAYNERCVLKYPLACDLVRKFWLQREWMIFSRAMPSGRDGFLETISGASMYLSKIDLEFCNKYCEQIIELVKVVCEIEQNDPTASSPVDRVQ